MMGHSELTAESPHHSSGNYVILDAIEALKWVHENIARFGGNPGSVTLFGQSGGANITSLLLTSPLTKGLIHRAIIESGAPAQYNRPTPSLHTLEQSGVLAAEALNAPPSGAVKYMRGLPVSDIVAASGRLFKMKHNPYDEGIDGYAIPKSPSEAFRSHTEWRVPIIIGSTSDDSASIEGVTPLIADASQKEVAAWVEGALKTFYGKYPDLLERAQKIYGLRGTPNEVSAYPPIGPIQQQLGVDLHERCPVQTTALWHSTIAPTWTYEFSRSIPGHLPVHASELRFVFGYLSTDELADPSAHKLADDMQQYWTNFAKTGDPNGPGLPVWSRYDAATKQSVEFTNDGPVQRIAMRAVACGPYIDQISREPKPLLVK